MLLSCNRSNISEVSVSAKTYDSAVQDIPVLVDTSFADTIEIKNIEASDTFEIKDTETPNTIKPNIQSIYTSFIGVREKSGKNDGPEVEMFLRTVGLGKGYPWCAAFVKYCLLEAGIESAKKINGMALSCENKSDFVYNKGKKIKEVEAGDVFTLYYAKLKRIGHTGFVDKEINSSIFESVEGNTNIAGSREGDGVYRKKRSYNATYSISRWQ